MNRAVTIKSEKLGKDELRLVKLNGTFFGLANGVKCAEGENPDQVWKQLKNNAGKSHPNYFGYDGARSRFLKFFPDGFQSTAFIDAERKYKVDCKEKFCKAVPLEQATSINGFGEAVLAAFRSTNLLSPFEKTRLQGVLRGPDADQFVRAAARFTLDSNKTNLFAMKQALKENNCDKWTVVTYLPFLWRPDFHMFLKPEVTQDFATRVGHRFAEEYEARLNLTVYESLINLVGQTTKELIDLKPRDGIDVQSFIWIVGNYQEGREDVPMPTQP